MQKLSIQNVCKELEIQQQTNQMGGGSKKLIVHPGTWSSEGYQS